MAKTKIDKDVERTKNTVDDIPSQKLSLDEQLAKLKKKEEIEDARRTRSTDIQTIKIRREKIDGNGNYKDLLFFQQDEKGRFQKQQPLIAFNAEDMTAWLNKKYMDDRHEKYVHDNGLLIKVNLEEGA